MKRYRRTNVLAVFCALASVFLILYGCGGGGDDGGGGPVAVTYGISGQATLTGSGLSGVTMALSGVRSGNAITDASGNYSFTGLDNGSYTITPSKTGFTFSPTSSPKTVSGANITGVNFIATPVAPSAAFLQADLAGTWDFLEFDTGLGSGWSHSVMAINDSGNLTSATNFLDNRGNTSIPPEALTLHVTVDSTGIVSFKDAADVDVGLHAHMSLDKKLVVGVMGNDNNASPGLLVLRKRTGAAFASADLANKTFVYHDLFSGTDNNSGHGTGTTDSSRLTVSSTGIMTVSDEPAFYGIVTDDKKVIFYVNSFGAQEYEFGVLTITGQTYTQADLAGVTYFTVINSATFGKPGWAYGSSSMDNVGNGTYLTYQDATNGAMPPPYTLVISATGVMTAPANPSYHGQLSWNKDLIVRTGINANGRSQLVISIR
jgi:hypothetical protein